MNPIYFTIIVSILALAGQLANFILHLTIRAELVTLEKRVLDQVRQDFVPRESCALLCGTKAEHRHAT